MSKISLYGFNNLTKNLSFSIYKLHYLSDSKNFQDYSSYINKLFSADKLNTLLVKICHAIGGNVLNVAKQDYQPQGASVTLMISEEAKPEFIPYSTPDSIVAHLDKSHLCIHTYPEETPQNNIAVFRADIELSTCGVISPLKVLNFIIEQFNADVVDIDYRVRGMTRNLAGKKLFKDEKINNISDHLNENIMENCYYENHNLSTRDIFHCKLCKKKPQLHDYVFGDNIKHLSMQQQHKVTANIEQEIKELFTKSN